MRWLAAAMVAVALLGCSAPAQRVALLPEQRDNYRNEAAPAPAPTALKGVATWYGQPGTSKPTVAWYTRPNEYSNKPFRFYAAAGPALRAFLGKPNGHFYHVHYRLLVTNPATNTTIVVDLVDWCGCRGNEPGKADDKVIDLSPAAFQALGVPLSRGLQTVIIEELP